MPTTTPVPTTTIPDVCASNPCMNGGRCVQSGTAYSCTCPDGFTGLNCEAGNHGEI